MRDARVKQATTNTTQAKIVSFFSERGNKLHEGWLRPSSTTTLFLAAVIVGLGTAIGGIFFVFLIERLSEFLFGTLPGWFPLGRAWLLFIPALGGLVAGPIIAFFAREAKGHGVPEVMQAIALRGGRIRPRVAVAKVIASSACIGSGGSAGREGPIVQVGAALGSTLAQWLHFPESRIRNLVACGAAAGIAATFNAPIAGVIFAIEIILGEMALADLGSVVLSAVTASTLARAVLGDTPAFSIPLYSLKSPWEIFLYLGLGVVSAAVGIFFIKVLYYAEDVFDNWKFPDALKPAVGGLLLGLTGLTYPLLLGLTRLPDEHLNNGLPVLENIPHVYASGFGEIGAALLGQMPVLLMLVLIFLKVLATAFTLGSGNSGGVFAPGLFMGAMTGGVFGSISAALFPQIATGPGPYATVGMAAVFAAAARAPLTAILIVFEMTDDYRILVPLMAAVAVSTALAQHWHKESIYTLKLVRKGIRLFRGRDMDVMASVMVEEVMDRHPETVHPDATVGELVALLDRTRRHGFPVVDEKDRLVGIVSLNDIRRGLTEGAPIEQLRIRDIATSNPVTVHPDDTLRQVLQRMAPRDLSRLPVVARDDARKLVGIVRRSNIVKAYELGLARRGFALGVLPGSPNGTASGRFTVPENSSLVGRTLADIGLPDTLLVIHIERGSAVILPRGATQLQAGDTITLLARDGDVVHMSVYWKEINAPQEVQ
ncbi:MAG: chloride channel protein [Chloroflexota bacterium]